MMASGKKLSALVRLFRYVALKEALSYLRRKAIGQQWISITLKDGTHAQALSAPLLNLLPFKAGLFEEEMFRWNIRGEAWIASYAQIVGLSEYVDGDTQRFYAAPYQNARVLDIGGFVGDTARFFLKEGARKVVIVEPSEKNLRAMRVNLQGYEHQVSMLQKAFSSDDRPMQLLSEAVEGSSCFGLGEGAYALQCAGISFASLLSFGPFDIAKVDCEGGERHLLTSEDALLKRIPYWIIETHDLGTRKEILRKFCGCGFHLVKALPVSEGVDVLHLEPTFPFKEEVGGDRGEKHQHKG